MYIVRKFTLTCCYDTKPLMRLPTVPVLVAATKYQYQGVGINIPRDTYPSPGIVTPRYPTPRIPTHQNTYFLPYLPPGYLPPPQRGLGSEIPTPGIPTPPPIPTNLEGTWDQRRDTYSPSPMGSNKSCFKHKNK